MPPAPVKPRPAPFSIRLSPQERQTLLARAGGLPLGTYAKSVLLGTDVPRRRTRAASADEALLARVLAALGASRLASNLNQIAKQANLGSLPVTQELEDDLRRACAEISEMRALMMTALGILKTDKPDENLSETFLRLAEGEPE